MWYDGREPQRREAGELWKSKKESATSGATRSGPSSEGFLMAVAASFLVSGYSGLYAKQKFAFSKTASPEGLAHEARREPTGPL